MAAQLSEIEVKGVKIPLIYEKSTLMPAVNLQIVFTHAGSITDEIPGLASLSARIFNEGTKTLGSVEFAKELENRAISLSVGSGNETLVFDMSALKSEYLEGLRLTRELLRQPNFTKEALSKVKTDIKASLLRKESDFDYVAQVELHRRLFEGTPLEHPSMGNRESIEKITLKEVEEFWKKRGVLRRAIVLVGGDVELEEVKKDLLSLLSVLPLGEEGELVRYEAKGDLEVKSVIKNTQQAYIYFGSPFSVKNLREDSYKAKVAAFVLGSSGFGSRMMEEIRVKRGLAYSAYWRISLSKSVNYSLGYLQTKLENEQQAIGVVRELIEEFLQKGITEKELEGAKQFLLGSEPLRNETLSQRLSSAFSAYYRGLPLDFAKEELRKIEALTLEEINAYIKEHQELLQLSFSVVTAPKE